MDALASTHLHPTLHLHASGAVTYAGIHDWTGGGWDDFGNDVVLAVAA